MRLRDALEQGCNGFSVCAAAQAWRPSPSPWPPSAPPRGTTEPARGRSNTGLCQPRAMGAGRTATVIPMVPIASPASTVLTARTGRTKHFFYRTFHPPCPGATGVANRLRPGTAGVRHRRAPTHCRTIHTKPIITRTWPQIVGVRADCATI